MRSLDGAKLGLGACALVLFAWSIRTGAPEYRWAAVACLLAAFLLRFARPRA
jgi:hypothetical protein